MTGKNLVEYPNTINAKKREIEWTSEKKDAEGNVWFFNRAFIKVSITKNMEILTFMIIADINRQVILWLNSRDYGDIALKTEIS